MADTQHVEEIRKLMQQAAERRHDGASRESNEALLHALELCSQHHGAFHARTHTVQTILAFNYREQGKYHESESLDREVLDRRQELLGDNHPETAKSLNNLALDLKGLGRNSEALELEKKALDIMVGLEGEESQTTMTSMNNLANSYANDGRYQEAAELHEKVLEVRRRILDDDDPRVFASMDLLGFDYRALGQVSRAIQLQESAVEGAQENLGDDHETTIKCMINLAGSCQELNNDDGRNRAVSVLEGALRSLQTAEEEESPLTIGLKNNLAVAYTKVDRMQEARPLLVSCHEWNKKILGEEHPRTRASWDNLTWILEELGELVKAPAVSI
ncbi:Tetratricopeptide repeat-domain-containing protein [Aspergillus crustosus]